MVDRCLRNVCMVIYLCEFGLNKWQNVFSLRLFAPALNNFIYMFVCSSY